MNKNLKLSMGLAGLVAGAMLSADCTPSKTTYEQGLDRLNRVLSQRERISNGNKYSVLTESFGIPNQGGITYTFERFNEELTLERREDLARCEGRIYTIDEFGKVTKVGTLKQKLGEAPGFNCEYTTQNQTPTTGDQQDVTTAVLAVRNRI